MNHTPETAFSKHQQVAQLLPWYVNQTLHSDERDLVEAHLKSCLVCRKEITSLQKLSASVQQSEAMDALEHAALLQLKSRIHKTARPGRTKAPVFSRLAGFRQWIAKIDLTRLPLQYPGAVFTALLLLTVSLTLPGLFDVRSLSGSRYHTLSSTKSMAPSTNEIRVVFSSDITPEQIARILASVKGEIISKPTAQGVYRVRIGDEAMTHNEILQTVSMLRKNSRVIFAEPTFALLLQSRQGPG